MQPHHVLYSSMIDRFSSRFFRFSPASLLDVLLHVFVTEVGRLRPAVAIKHGKVNYVVGHLGKLEAVLVLLALADEGGRAHLGQADFGDDLAVADAGGQQDGLVDAVVPDAEGVPGGGGAAAVRVEAGVAGAPAGGVQGSAGGGEPQQGVLEDGKWRRTSVA